MCASSFVRCFFSVGGMGYFDGTVVVLFPREDVSMTELKKEVCFVKCPPS